MPGDNDPRPVRPDDVGARLRAAREAKQISLEEIAAKTKIFVGSLRAIEANDPSRLPGGIFTRAFVRAFAAEVGLDPEETVRDFMARALQDSAEDVQQATSQTGESDVFLSQQRVADVTLKLVVVGAVVAGLLLFFASRQGTVPESAPDVSTPVAPGGAERALPEPAPAPDPPAERGLAIVLHPSDDCFVRLTIDGELVLSRLMNAGERESYEADDEILLRVGDAGAFEYTLNQQKGRTLGGSREVVNERITIDNYRSYITP